MNRADWSVCWCLDGLHVAGAREADPGTAGGVMWRTLQDAVDVAVKAPGGAHVIQRRPEDDLGPIAGVTVLIGALATIVALALMVVGYSIGRGDIAAIGFICLLALITMGYPVLVEWRRTQDGGS